MSFLDSISDFFSIFVDSLTEVESVIGIYNFSLGGIVIEHPLIFWLILPLFFVGFIIGLRYPKFGAFFTITILIVIAVLFIILIGFGIDIESIIVLIFFLVTLPITFATGSLIGWLFYFVLSRVCDEREGGILCNLID